jgi:hypothetical protein
MGSALAVLNMLSINRRSVSTLADLFRLRLP